MTTVALCKCTHAERIHVDGLCKRCACAGYVAQEDVREEFSTDEVCQLVGCTFRQLDYWIRTGRVVAVGSGRGSGTQRQLRRHEIDVLVTVLSLIDAGFVLDKAFEYGRQLVETDEPVQVGCVLIGGSS